MDIENLTEEPKEAPAGLLAPRKLMSNNTNNNKKIEQPVYRVAQHMKEIRNRREMLKNGT
jgi:hypothetical protein